MNWILIKIAARILNRIFKRLKKRNSALDYYFEADYKSKCIYLYVRHPEDPMWDKIRNNIPDSILGVNIHIRY